ncbi:hypothetical protein B4960_11350 [Listeria monocytogenes]|nr:hypothetical protein [Listeria monocytogenes]EAD0069558.1 hypothetical protein [Listeria monocytogenes]EAE6700068.1 hypothetical protein [Listeria monocytogenes]EAE7765912.1 hypothetical protein [Listeria monocytogenes]EAE8881124.1 hypothetical protein [Listeria monocytogenes]
MTHSSKSVEEIIVELAKNHAERIRLGVKEKEVPHEMVLEALALIDELGWRIDIDEGSLIEAYEI